MPADYFGHIVIAVCTRQRPTMLKSCLESVLRQSLSAATKISLLVIENDSEPLSEALVRQLQTTTSADIHYRLESDIGIAQARNRALHESLLLNGDWLWFLDDDEIADKNCLQELINASFLFNAEVIHGKVTYQYPASDRWGKLSQQALRQPQHGKRIHTAATNNVLFSSRLFSESGLALHFDPYLRLCGGEDTFFFKQACQQGVVMVFSEKALVFETVPANRCSLLFLLSRQCSRTASGVYIDENILGHAQGKKKHLRRLRQNLIQLLAALLASPFMMLRDLRPHKTFLSLLMKAATAYGRWRGLRGKLFNSYQHISEN